MQFLINLLINTLSVALAAYLVPGVTIDDWLTAFIVSIVLGVINTILKPILVIITLPITILTLGLFYLVINVFIIYLVSQFVPGFQVSGFMSALIFGFVLSIISWFLGKMK